MIETEDSPEWTAADSAAFLQSLQTAPSAKTKLACDGATWFTLHTIYIPQTCLYYGLTAVLRRKHLHWYYHAGNVNPRRAKHAMRTAKRYWKALRRRQVSHPQETKRFLDLILPPRSTSTQPETMTPEQYIQDLANDPAPRDWSKSKHPRVQELYALGWTLAVKKERDQITMYAWRNTPHRRDVTPEYVCTIEGLDAVLDRILAEAFTASGCVATSPNQR